MRFATIWGLKVNIGLISVHLWSCGVEFCRILTLFYFVLTKYAKINSNYLKMSGLSSRNVRYPRYQDTDLLQLWSYKFVSHNKCYDLQELQIILHHLTHITVLLYWNESKEKGKLKLSLLPTDSVSWARNPSVGTKVDPKVGINQSEASIWVLRSTLTLMPTLGFWAPVIQADPASIPLPHPRQNSALKRYKHTIRATQWQHSLNKITRYVINLCLQGPKPQCWH